MRFNMRQRIVGISVVVMCCVLHIRSGHALDVRGVITDNTRWTVAESPYRITGDILVQQNTVLTIDPGVTVFFANGPSASVGYYMRVDGELIADGTTEHPILFTAEDKANLWGCIAFTDTSMDWNVESQTGSIIRNCIIEYAGNGQGNIHEFGNAAIKIISARPNLADNIIRRSQNGISATSGPQRITGNRIYATGIAIELVNSGGLIEYNYLFDNQIGIVVNAQLNQLEITNNTIDANTSQVSGGCLQILLNSNFQVSRIPLLRLQSNQWVRQDNDNVMIRIIASDNAVNYDIQFTENNFISAEMGRVVSLEGWFHNSAISDLRELVLNPISMENNWWGTIDLDRLNDRIYDVQDAYFLPQIKVEPILMASVENAGSGSAYPPLANAGTDQGGLTPETEVILDGSQTHDPDNILTYAWHQTQGPAVSLREANSRTPYFYVPLIEDSAENRENGLTLVFQLTVSAPSGISDSDDVNITVFPFTGELPDRDTSDCFISTLFNTSFINLMRTKSR